MAGLPGSCWEMSYVVFYSDTLWQSGTSMTHCSLTTNLKAPQRKCVCISLFHWTTNQVWRWGAGLPPCQWTEVCIKVMNADPPLPHSCPVVAGDWWVSIMDLFVLNPLVVQLQLTRCLNASFSFTVVTSSPACSWWRTSSSEAEWQNAWPSSWASCCPCPGFQPLIISVCTPIDWLTPLCAALIFRPSFTWPGLLILHLQDYNTQ